VVVGLPQAGYLSGRLEDFSGLIFGYVAERDPTQAWVLVKDFR
jgi:hypothetical protein